MKRHILALIVLTIPLLAGCNENQTINSNIKHEITSNELEKAITDKNQLEKDLNNAENRIG